MATYKGIQGYSVQSLSSDPTASEVVGQLWYNSGSGKFKIAVAGAGAWSSGNDMVHARKQFTGAGTTTAAIAFGGGVTSYSETYNGSTWSESTDLNTPRGQLASATQGSTTASLAFAGATNPGSPSSADDETELWNGSTWAEQSGDLNTARRWPMGAGITTAALCGGGQTSPTATLDVSEEYDGSTWTEGDNLNTGRNAAGGCGTQTAAVVAAGRLGDSSSTDKTETYNGTSWTEVNACNTARNQVCTGIGLQTAALLVGGQPSPAYTEQWDGTSWTEVGDLATGRSGGTSAGTSSLGLVGGGEVPGSPGTTAATEEWNDPVYTNKTVTVS